MIAGAVFGAIIVVALLIWGITWLKKRMNRGQDPKKRKGPTVASTKGGNLWVG